MKFEIRVTDGEPRWAHLRPGYKVAVFGHPAPPPLVPLEFQLNGKYMDVLYGESLPDLLVQMAVVIRQNPDLFQE